MTFTSTDGNVYYCYKQILFNIFFTLYYRTSFINLHLTILKELMMIQYIYNNKNRFIYLLCQF